jgi:hypothetical protein
MIDYPFQPLRRSGRRYPQIRSPSQNGQSFPAGEQYEQYIGRERPLIESGDLAAIFL